MEKSAHKTTAVVHVRRDSRARRAIVAFLENMAKIANTNARPDALLIHAEGQMAHALVHPDLMEPNAMYALKGNSESTAH